MYWELIIFDCDGVLVDSEPIANRIMAEAISALGWPLTAADCIARFKGHHFDTVIAAVEDRLGRPVPGGWLPDLRAERIELLELAVRVAQGAADLHAARRAHLRGVLLQHERRRIAVGIEPAQRARGHS